MSPLRNLPQLGEQLFLTDGGIETVLIFNEGIDLPLFAAFTLLDDEQGTERLRRYYEPYLALAAEAGTGFVLESPTWRASPDWAEQLGYDACGLDRANRKAIELLEEIRSSQTTLDAPIVISGCIGPQGDGYDPDDFLTPDEAEAYHSDQVGSFAGTTADMVTAITMTYVEEAIGIAQAAAAAEMPVAISFTVETDGRLPSGQRLGEAIEEVDSATDGATAYFMVNCAHPTHFSGVLEDRAPWTERLRGIRANASTMSHAELDEADELDPGDPADLGSRYAALRERLPQITVLGGCCGTDHRHVAEIRDACIAPS